MPEVSESPVLQEVYPPILASGKLQTPQMNFSERGETITVLSTAGTMSVALGDERLRWLASRVAGDEVDVAALAKEHAPLLYRVAFSVVRSATEAEDVMQETFLRALQHRRKLKEVDCARAWLLRVVWNLSMDRKRRVPAFQLDEKFAMVIASQEVSADQRITDAEDLARVLAAMDKLPKLERSVLLLTAFEELSVTEIATALGKSASSVRSLTYRAREHLQQRLGTVPRSKVKGRDDSDHAK